MYEWDEAKRQETLKRHSVDFADIESFDWSSAVTREDRRRNYGERRFISYSDIDGRLYCCAWTRREGRIRIIALRKANARERRHYEQEKKLH